MKTLRIAAVQMRSTRSRPENLERARALMLQAVRLPALHHIRHEFFSER